jgi:hypothetical protein
MQKRRGRLLPLPVEEGWGEGQALAALLQQPAI